MPGALLTGLLALACFRAVRLVAYDDITTSLRAWYGRMPDTTYQQWLPVIEEARADGGDPWDWAVPRRPEFTKMDWYLAKLVRCPWCVGFWISLAAAILSASAGLTSWGWVFPFAFALSALVGFLAHWLDP